MRVSGWGAFGEGGPSLGHPTVPTAWPNATSRSRITDASSRDSVYTLFFRRSITAWSPVTRVT